jgi:hypothetical protein
MWFKSESKKEERIKRDDVVEGEKSDSEAGSGGRRERPGSRCGRTSERVQGGG